MNNSPSNPYAAPMSFTEPRPQHNCSRSGSLLIVPAGGTLPERCVRCNEPATMDQRKTYSWHHPALYLLILPGLLIYAIAATLVSKKAKVSIGLCEAHRARRRNFGRAAFALLLVGLGALFAAVSYEDGRVFGVLSGLSLLAAVLVASFGTRVLIPKSIDREEARFKGCGDIFLASLSSEPRLSLRN